MTAHRLKCSFCGKSADDVAKLVAGGAAQICETCVAHAAHIMQLSGPPTPPATPVQSAWRALADRILKTLRLALSNAAVAAR